MDENVFAYSNRTGNERALVVYNNRYGEAHGTIDFSAAYADKATCAAAPATDRRWTWLCWRSRRHPRLARFAHRPRIPAPGSDFDERGLTFHLHAYQCHVLLDWHEKWASAEKPWDRLCDQLNGRGVPNLEDELIKLELQPVHDALRSLLEQDMIRLLSDLAEHPRTTAGNGSVSAAVDRKQNRKRSELFNVAWTRCEAFLRTAQSAHRARTGGRLEMTMPGLLGPAFRERVAAAMRIPVVESISPEPWTAAARRVLPSPSPQMTATAMWAPIIAWCVLETLAESIHAQEPGKVGTELFDHLRLRKPLAESFNRLGFEGEAGWRAAARIKVLLLAESKNVPAVTQKDARSDASPAAKSPIQKAETEADQAGIHPPILKPFAGGLPRELWSDPDVRWLTGAHNAGEYTYLVLEPYEELLWWLQVPTLLRIAESSSPSKSEVQLMSGKVRTALAESKKAGYRLQAMLGADEPEKPSQPEIAGAGKPEKSEPSARSNITAKAKEKEEKPV